MRLRKTGADPRRPLNGHVRVGHDLHDLRKTSNPETGA
jgi:hypothetical protein